MSAGSALIIDEYLSIPDSELRFRASRAGGPGGQHVNTSSTRVELLWNLSGSRAVTDEQRDRLQRKLAARLDAEGNVRVVGSAYRSQARNRDAARERLAELVHRALVIPKRRKKTRPSRAAMLARLREKRARSEKKQRRQGPGLDE